jgi:hypothetical protein
VIVEMLHSSEGIKTKGGVVVGFNTDVVYAEGDNSWAADLQEVYGRVWKAPQRLYFNPKDKDSMDWDTDCEIEKGDIVWFGIIESNNALEIECEGTIYKILPYSDLYVARKGGFDGEAVCLNGYVLIEPAKGNKISDLDFISEDKIDKVKGIVRYFGSCNRRYRNKHYADIRDLRIGDLVLIDPRARPFPLERKSYLARFDGDNLYLVIQRRRIEMVLNN